MPCLSEIGKHWLRRVETYTELPGKKEKFGTTACGLIGKMD